MIIAHVFLIYALKVISREEPIVQNLPICEERYDYRIPAPSSELGLRLIDDKFLKIKYSFNNIPRVKDSANNPINYRYLHLLLKVDDQRIKSRKLEVGSEYDDFDLKISLPKNFKGEFSVISFYEDEENWISPKREDLFTVSADIGELMAIKIVKKSIEPNDELSIVNKRRTEDVIFKFETMSEVPEQPKIEEIKVDVSAPTLGYEFSKWSEADSFNNFKCDIPICTPVTLTFTPSFKSRSKLGQRSQMETLLLPDMADQFFAFGGYYIRNEFILVTIYHKRIYDFCRNKIRAKIEVLYRGQKLGGFDGYLSSDRLILKVSPSNVNKLLKSLKYDGFLQIKYRLSFEQYGKTVNTNHGEYQINNFSDIMLKSAKDFYSFNHINGMHNDSDNPFDLKIDKPDKNSVIVNEYKKKPKYLLLWIIMGLVGLIGTVFVVMFKIYRRETLMDLETERVTLRTRVTEEGRADMTNKSIIDHLMSKDNIKTAEISK